MRKQNEIDYYESFISYVKIIMNTIVQNNEPERMTVNDIYNNYFNFKVQEDEEKGNIFIREMIIITALFENKLYTLNDIEKKALIRFIYAEYLKPIICNYSNGDIEASLMLFELMNEKVKELVGYNFLYNNSLNSKAKIVIKKNERGI